MANSKKNKKIIPARVQAMGNERAQEIDKLLETFERLVDHNAGLLSDSLIKGFVEKLEVKDGQILSGPQNLKRIALIEKAYSEFASSQGMKIATTLLTDMEGIMALNSDYFKELTGGKIIDEDQVKAVIRQRLGIGEGGELLKDGYMQGLLDDPTVREEIKNFAYTRMPAGAGFQEFRQGLKDLIQGSSNDLGIFQKFYRNYAFDSYAQVDAMNGQLYAQKLGLKYFIYNGGIMRDKKGKVRSRAFCVHRAGKVFSSAEAEKWKDDKELTAVDSKATYNWAIQRGGFACRHSIDYISEELALEMRPDLAGEQVAEKAADVPTIKEVEANPERSFTPAKTVAEAEDRIRGLGVKEVNLKGLKPPMANAVLNALEQEAAYGNKFGLDKVVTYRSSGLAKALYSPSNNSISINLAYVNKFEGGEVIKSYPDQLHDLKQQLEVFKNNYQGNPKYKQSAVYSRINSFNNRIFDLGQKIEAGEQARPWTVSGSAATTEESLRATVLHELGHYRHYRTIGESEYFPFQKINSVSEYGRTNSHEYFAEWFSHYRLKGAEGVPEAMLKLFKRIDNAK